MIYFRRLTPFVLGFGVSLAAFAMRAGGATTIHVAVDGNDTWSVALAAPDGKGGGPFATPGRAVRALGERRNANADNLAGPVTIEFHAVTYVLADPFVLTPEDSGTADAPVMGTAHGHDAVVFSGGVPITGWKETELNGRKAWVAKSP